ncbi:topoisomerase II-associated protein PAT1-domain-containing protein [Chytriomyces sp. MP71]|nr:topoisomerase II-associated protein PAT1-domain-containing protein [Chytriomyces sp. MP71]
MSFFGFNTELPSRPAARDGAEGGAGSRVDELLEERFKYGTGLGDEEEGAVVLDDDDEELNDETFGDVGDIGTDFDFTGGAKASFPVASDDFFAMPPTSTKGKRPVTPPAKPSQPGTSWQSPGNLFTSSSVPPSGPKMMSLEEIESQILATNRNQPAPQQPQPPLVAHQHFPPGMQPSFGHPSHFPGGQQQGGQFVGDKRVMSVTEIEEGLLRQKHEQQQQSQPQGFVQNMMGPGGPPFPGQFPPGYPHGGPNVHPNMPFPLQGPMGMAPMMGPPGSPANMHVPPHFNGPMGLMLQNQVFNQPPPPPQFDNQQPGSFPGSSHLPNPNGPLPQQAPGSGGHGGVPFFVGGPGGASPNSNLPQDEMLRNAQMMAQQQHQMHMQQQQQRGAGRGEYGQMRYNTANAQNNKRNVLMHTGFSTEDNPQRGANGKGPGPFDGGWSHHSNRTPRWIRYADSMTQYEKETIARIQISQLVSEDPYRDDFYYQIYSLFKSGADSSINTAGENWKQSTLQGKDSGNELQAQMKKLIEGKKLKPKGTTLALEGALGKISLTSVKNPRQLIQINQGAKDSHTVPTFNRLTRRKILKSIERVYTCILNLEQLKRKPPVPGSDEEEAWTTETQQNVTDLWEELSLAENIPFTQPHPFPYLLSYSKGKKAIPRLVPYLTPDQMFSALTTVFSRAESLDVCNMPAGTQDEAIDLFVSTVIPPLVSFVSEVPLQVVNAFMRILLERHNMVWLAKSKAGLAFLALLLSRAEILKQGGGAQHGLRPPGADDLALWAELYNFLFVSLQGNFAAIFPPPAEADSSGVVKSHDEVYIWQFLAAMAVGATSADHQRVLLTEVRDKIFETSRRGSASDNAEDQRALMNVNLFLNALGLGIDASQLASM